MQMNRRIEKLEAALPENEISFRVLLNDKGEPTPGIDPPLRQNEHAIVVNFVTPGGMRHG